MYQKILDAATDIISDIQLLKNNINKDIHKLKTQLYQPKIKGEIVQTILEKKEEVDKGKLGYWKILRLQQVDLCNYSTNNIFKVLILFVCDPILRLQKLQRLKTEFQNSSLAWYQRYQRQSNKVHSQLEEQVIRRLMSAIWELLDKKEGEVTYTVIKLIQTYNIVELLFEIFLRSLCRNRCNRKLALFNQIENMDTNIQIDAILQLLKTPLEFKVIKNLQERSFTLQSKFLKNKIIFTQQKNGLIKVM